jgi:hypothetical protein
MSTMQATSTLLEKIRSRGYWRVILRPSTFKRHRIAQLQDLFPIVQKSTVRFHTWWEYPQIDGAKPPLYGTDWVGQESERGMDMRVWRLYQSGQFVQFDSVSEDWPLDLGGPPEEERTWGKKLEFRETHYHLSKIFEFASNLARTPAGDGWMHVEIHLEGLAGRRLEDTRSKDGPKFGDYRTQAANWTLKWDRPQGDLIDAPRDLAAEAAQDLFAHFGLNLSTKVLKLLQEENRN